MPETAIELASSPSTNSELAARIAAGDAADWTVVTTRDQTAGRGRADRVWQAPAGTAIAMSVAVPLAGIPAPALGWLPLAAGVAVVDALTAVPGIPRAALKWPNDVLLDDRKVCGILAELHAGHAVVGIGVNLVQTAAQLPVPTATSLALAGAGEDADSLAGRMLTAVTLLRGTVTALAAAGGDPEASGLAAAVRDRCSTLGREVRVELPGGGELVGRAETIDAAGRIVVAGTPVAAGDVVHLRTR